MKIKILNVNFNFIVKYKIDFIINFYKMTKLS